MGNYVRYLATREGVQPVSNDRYLHYIAMRPRSHGLFSYYGTEITLSKVAKEVEQHSGVVWRAIISLTREDAARLGYDTADRWQELLNANASEIANIMGIEPADFRWYAAYHDEGNHPHIHMVAYSQNPGREYLSEQGVEKIRSLLARQIFKNELQQIYEKQTMARGDVYAKAQVKFHELLTSMRQGIYDSPKMEDLLAQLADALEKHKGKKVYGYLNASTKKLVDAIVDTLAEDDTIAQAYTAWYELRRQVLHTYRDDTEEPPPLSVQPEFKTVRNMVIREVSRAMRGMTDDEEQQAAAYRAALDEAQFFLGDTADNTLAEVRRLYRMAQRGDSYAMYRLAVFCLDKTSPCYDPKKALSFLEVGAQHGHAFSQYRLATQLLSGEFCTKDSTRALRLLEQAADQQNQFAQYLLGKLYLFGREVPRDFAKANAYLAASALQGNEYAQYLLDRHDEWNRVQLLTSATRLARALAALFEQKLPQPRGFITNSIDRKRIQELRKKKIALGHARDDMDIKL